MVLSMEQLQALSKLAIKEREVKAATAARDEAEFEAWRAGVSLRQIAAVGRDSYASVRRRCDRQIAIEAEHRVAA